MFWRFWPGNGLKWKFSLKTISRLTRKDKERERESLRLRRSTNPWTDLRPRVFDPRAFDFASDLEPSRHEPIFDPEPSTHKPSTSPATQSLRATNPRTDLSLSLSFWFSVWFWSINEPIYVSVWFWFFTFFLWSLIFLLLLGWCGWWCFGGFPVVWWWVLCGWWWKITFSEYYQTHENIF